MFRRTKSAAESGEPPAKADGKGRPTPTRKEAEAAARARAKAAPKSRRELAATDRRARVMARDAGPVRAFVRDLIDSRLSISELMIPILVITLIFGWSGVTRLVIIGNLLLYATLVTILFEAVLTRFRVRREVARRFPGESTSGLTFYAVTRGMQMRFMRMPKPRVKIGQQLPEHDR